MTPPRLCRASAPPHLAFPSPITSCLRLSTSSLPCAMERTVLYRLRVHFAALAPSARHFRGALPHGRGFCGATAQNILARAAHGRAC